MAEYIDKKQAIDKFIEGDGDNEFTEGYNFAVNEYKKMIKAMPTADVQLIKHGRWSECYIDTNNYSGICSVCGKASIKSLTESLYAFCPKCGAIMDGDNK